MYSTPITHFDTFTAISSLILNNGPSHPNKILIKTIILVRTKCVYISCELGLQVIIANKCRFLKVLNLHYAHSPSALNPSSTPFIPTMALLGDFLFTAKYHNIRCPTVGLIRLKTHAESYPMPKQRASVAPQNGP